MINVRKHVNALWQSHEYKEVVNAIESIRPPFPRYDPITNNVEQAKYLLAQIQMHDLVMTILKPKATGEPDE